ncbi:hypothetical protein HZA96_01235 [Candidatus Woesearchaeota archaeon]|nr:hypothetical protein [Candidatus Woesearchaeota archaeon]
MPQLITAKLRPWGNSLGLTVPREIVIKKDLKPNDIITFELKKGITVKELMENGIKGTANKVDIEKMRLESKKMWGMD